MPLASPFGAVGAAGSRVGRGQVVVSRCSSASSEASWAFVLPGRRQRSAGDLCFMMDLFDNVAGYDGGRVTVPAFPFTLACAKWSKLLRRISFCTQEVMANTSNIAY